MESHPETFVLQPGKTYILIDYVYLCDFAGVDFNDSNLSNLEETFFSLRKEVFKYSYNPYALYTSNNSLFALNKIKSIEATDINPATATQFCSDSGLILIIDLNKFITFMNDFDDVKIFESIEGIDHLGYWPGIVKKYPGEIYYFFTADIDSESSGGGNFEIV